MLNFIKLFFFTSKLKRNHDVKSLISYVVNDEFIPAPTAGNKSFLYFELWDQDSSQYRPWQLNESYNFTISTKYEFAEVDIRLISSLVASKSNLNDFSSLEEMVERNAPYLIKDISVEAITKLMEHNQIRPEYDYVSYYDYLKRYILSNSGGSHHFAAAKYISNKLNHPYYINRKSNVVSLNRQAISGICGNYEIFILNENGFHHLTSLCINSDRLFKFYIKPYPIKHVKKLVVFLPRNNPYSMAFSNELKSHECTFINSNLLMLLET